MITVLFFAQIREQVGVDKLQVEANFTDVETLKTHLCQRSEVWSAALSSPTLLVAVNQTISPFNTKLTSGDEVAFFPPVTGG